MSKKPTATGEKRSAETEVEENVSNKRPALENSGQNEIDGGNEEFDKTPPAIIMRSLISTKNVGAIIGRAGANVKSFREETQTRITISEESPGSNERILTVSGSVAGVAKAFALITVKIHESAEVLPGQPPPKPMAKILISNGQVGCIIGKAGSKIKEIQETTRSRVVISEEILPNSTERCVTISGTPESIQGSIELVSNQLIENPDKGQNVLYRPANSGRYASNASYPAYPAPSYPAYQEPIYAGSYGGFSQTNHFTLNSQPTTQQLYIPNELVGCIIGKGGSKISEIRQQSGSQVKIGELQNGTNERLVSITGTPESNQMALFLLYSRLQSERSRLTRS